MCYTVIDNEITRTRTTRKESKKLEVNGEREREAPRRGPDD